MLVSKIMHKTNLLPPETNLKEAALLMRDQHLGFTPISQNGKLLGVITDRDITIRAAANNIDMEESLVKDFMTSNVVVCYQDTDLNDAIKLMREKQIHRIIVLDDKKNQRVVGVLSLSDIAKKCKEKDWATQLAACRSEERTQ